MSDSPEKFEQWAIVELFGHQRIAGLVTEQQIGGCNFVRVDVPPVDGNSGFTRCLGNGAIYALNFVTEDVARAAAARFKCVPVTPFDLPELRQNKLRFDGADELEEEPEIPY